MNQLYAITNDDPRVQEGIRIIGNAGPVTQRIMVGTNGLTYVTTFWRLGIMPFEIGGDDFRQLEVPREGMEFISGELTTPLYRRISATAMLSNRMQLDYREPAPPPPPPPPPPVEGSPVGYQITGTIYAYVGAPGHQPGEIFEGDPRGKFKMHGSAGITGLTNVFWEKVA